MITGATVASTSLRPILASEARHKEGDPRLAVSLALNDTSALLLVRFTISIANVAVQRSADCKCFVLLQHSTCGFKLGVHGVLRRPAILLQLFRWHLWEDLCEPVFSLWSGSVKNLPTDMLDLPDVSIAVVQLD